MRKHYLGLFAFTLTSVVALASANAADIYVPGPAGPGGYKDAPWYPSWTGCYIGGNLGGGWDHEKTTRVSQDTVGPSFADYGSQSNSAFVGGGQIGCDYQFAPKWVIGIQGQADFGDIDGKNPLVTFPTFSEKTHTGSFETLTGRAGFLVTPSVLAYAKGGVAWLQADDKILLPGGGLSESAKFTLTGWTVGGGVEWQWSPHWSVFAEYKHMDFGDTNEHFIAPAGFFPPGEVLKINQTADSALVGVNYHIGFGAEPLK
jgi:outer membrane immunogenic protein